MKKFILFFILSGLYAYSLQAQKSVISIVNVKDEISKLEFHQFKDAIFNFEVPLCCFNLPEKDCSDSILIEKTTSLYTNFGPYKAWFIAEPGKSYEISLPDISGLSKEWKQNIYFSPSLFHLHVKEKKNESESSEINEKIRDFNRQLDPFIDKQLLRYYNPEYAKIKLDSFLNVNYKPLLDSTLSFYNDYILYKKGILEYSLSTHNLDYLICEYFAHKKVDFSNPGYRELFALVFQSYFNHLSNKKEYKDIFYHLATKYPEYIHSYLSNNILVRDDRLFEEVLLIEIYKAYYDQNYSRPHLIGMIDSIQSGSTNMETKNTSGKLRQRLTTLETGYSAPDFYLKNLHGDFIRLNDYKGKYVYLGFCNPQEISSLKEIEYLKYLHSRYGEKIEIITAFLKTEKENMEEFINENHISWTILPINYSDEIMKSYNISAFPDFFLIDKKGKLLQNQAPNPSENFEYRIFELLRSEK